jgi:hypothetical protein
MHLHPPFGARPTEGAAPARRVGTLALASLLVVLATACSDPGTGAVPGAETGNAETPPTGAEAVDAWIAEGHYLAWACEPEAHAARPPGAHGMNRICSNAALSEHDDGPYPVGSASVKELFRDGEIDGYAVTRRVGDGGAEDWYWYERIGGDLIADGPGDSGDPKDLCADCHEGAGTGDRDGHDFVFTQVR